MALNWYVFEVRNAGALQASLTPTFVHFKALPSGGPPFTNITPQPTIHEIANGQYAFQYDPNLHGEASVVVDAGSSISSPEDRYFGDITMNMLLSEHGLDPVLLENNQKLIRAVRRIAATTTGSSRGVGTATVTYYDADDAGSNTVLLVTADIDPTTRNRDNVDYED